MNMECIHVCNISADVIFEDLKKKSILTLIARQQSVLRVVRAQAREIAIDNR